jgi:hypothetical protein
MRTNAMANITRTRASAPSFSLCVCRGSQSGSDDVRALFLPDEKAPHARAVFHATAAQAPSDDEPAASPRSRGLSGLCRCSSRKGSLRRDGQKGPLNPSAKLTKKRYEWLHKHYPQRSDWIKARKEQINISTAHANIVSSHGIFRADSSDIIKTPFFDVEDEYVVRVDLQLIGSIALSFMDFLYGVNQGLNVIRFCADFAARVSHLGQENDALLTEMKQTDRFKRGAQKFGLPGT